jgi:hypothetical protein
MKQKNQFDILPCGCRLCGCSCPDHSPTRQECACPSHIVRFLAEEAAALVSLALFTGMIAVWAAIFSS